MGFSKFSHICKHVDSGKRSTRFPSGTRRLLYNTLSNFEKPSPSLRLRTMACLKTCSKFLETCFSKFRKHTQHFETLFVELVSYRNIIRCSKAENRNASIDWLSSKATMKNRRCSYRGLGPIHPGSRSLSFGHVCMFRACCFYKVFENLVLGSC